MTSTCQEDCFKGTIHTGPLRGSMEKIHDLDTYVVGNRDDPKGIIVMYPDVFGLGLINNKLLADTYAAKGQWLVYLVDFFKGDPAPLSVADLTMPVDPTKQSTIGKYTGLLIRAPLIAAWLMRHKEATASKTCVEFLGRLRRATPGTLKIGMVGFCYGGKYALQAGLERNMIEKDGAKVPLVDAIVALHPSMLSIPSDVKDLVVPAAFGWGLEDSSVKIEQKGMVEDAHAEAKRDGREVPEMEHKVYKPGRHGFAVRGNPDDPQERACLEESVVQVLKWFERWVLQ